MERPRRPSQAAAESPVSGGMSASERSATCGDTLIRFVPRMYRALYNKNNNILYRPLRAQTTELFVIIIVVLYCTSN